MAKKKTDETAPILRPARVKVRALKLGFAGEPPRRRREGDVFTIRGNRWPEGHAKAGQVIEFAESWMVIVPDDTPEVSVSPTDAAREAHARMATGPQRMDHHGTVHDDDGDGDDREEVGASTGDRNVLG